MNVSCSPVVECRQFRELDRPNRFVWLRGFADTEVRRNALESFYRGPVWALGNGPTVTDKSMIMDFTQGTDTLTVIATTDGGITTVQITLTAS